MSRSLKDVSTTDLLRRCVLITANDLRGSMIHRHTQLGLLRRRQGMKNWKPGDFDLSRQLST